MKLKRRYLKTQFIEFSEEEEKSINKLGEMSINLVKNQKDLHDKDLIDCIITYVTHGLIQLEEISKNNFPHILHKYSKYESKSKYATYSFHNSINRFRFICERIRETFNALCEEIKINEVKYHSYHKKILGLDDLKEELMKQELMKQEFKQKEKPNEYMVWCMKCQKKVNVNNISIKVIEIKKNSYRNKLCGICSICGSDVSHFLNTPQEIQKEYRERRKREHKRWTKQEEEKLIELHKRNKNIKNIAKELGRTFGSILIRLTKLHLLDGKIRTNIKIRVCQKCKRSLKFRELSCLLNGKEFCLECYLKIGG